MKLQTIRSRFALLALVLLGIQFLSLQGQNLVMTTTLPTLVQCGPAETFTVTLTNSSSNVFDSVYIDLSLFNGVQFDQNTFTSSGVPVQSVVVNSTDLHFLSPTVGPGEFIQFQFLAHSLCDSTSNGISSFSVNADHNQRNYTLASPSFNLLIPALAIQSVQPAAHNGTVDSSFTRTVTVINGGNGPLHNFLLQMNTNFANLEYSNFEVQSSIGNLPLSPTFGSNSITFSLDSLEMTHVGNFDSVLSQNETMSISYDVKVKTCLGQASYFLAGWGCSGSFCEISNSTANVLVNNQAPNITANATFFQDKCYGDNSSPSTTEIAFENTGGLAKNISIRFWVGNPNGSNGNFFASYDTSSIQWKSGATPSIFLTPSRTDTIQEALAKACLPNNIGFVEVQIDSMAPGERDTLVFSMFDCCKTWYEKVPGFTHRSWYEFDFQQGCDTSIQTAIPAVVIPGPTNYNNIFVQNVFLNGPNNLPPQTPSWYSLDHNSLFLLDATAGGTVEARITLPGNLKFSGGPGDLKFELGATSWLPVSVTQTPNANGDTVVQATFPLPAPSSILSAELKIKLEAICPAPCAGGPSPVYYHLSQIPDPNCNCEAIVTADTFSIDVDCGSCGCPNGGISFYRFDAVRANYGQPDNNGDGLPDNPPSQLDSSLVKRSFLMYGDTLRTVFGGIVETTGSNPNWIAGFLQTKMTPNGDLVQPIGQSIQIKDNSSGIVYAGQMPLPEDTLLPNNARYFTLSFDTTFLLNSFPTTPPLPPGFVFEQGDSITATLLYQMTQNIGPAVLPQVLTNSFALVNPNTQDTASCGGRNSSFTAVGFEHSVCCNNQLITTGCGPVSLHSNYRLKIGTTFNSDVFPNEYRNWGIPSEVRVSPPTGYLLDSVAFKYVRNVSGGTTAQTTQVLANTSGNPWTIPLSSSFGPSGSPGFEPGDEGYEGIVSLFLTPSCELGDTSVPVLTQYSFDFIPAASQLGYVFPPLNKSDTLNHEPPVAELTPTLALFGGIGDSVNLEVNLNNNSSAADAYHTWMTLSSPSGNIFPGTVSLDGQGNSLQPNAGGIYFLDTLAADSSKAISIRADYRTCSLDSLVMQMGWDCREYPSSIASIQCIADQVNLYIDPRPGELQVSVALDSTSYNLCDTIPVTLTIRSAQLARVLSPSILLELPTGLAPIPNSLATDYPPDNVFESNTNSFSPTANPNLFRLSLDDLDSTIRDHGFPGTTLPDSNVFVLQFQLATSCELQTFIRGFEVFSEGVIHCGDSVLAGEFTQPFNILGLSEPYVADLSANIEDKSSCPLVKTIEISLVNNGVVPTTLNDTIEIDLDAGLVYQGGFLAGTNSPVDSTLAIDNQNGNQVLSWPIPPYVQVGDSMTFSFDVLVTDSAPCNTASIRVSSLISNNLYCSSEQKNCLITQITGSFSLVAPIDLPILAISGFSSGLSPDSTGGIFSYSGSVSNSGSDIPGGTPTTIGFYCDSDYSGSYSSGDVLLGNHLTTDSITNAMPTFFSGSFFVPDSACTLGNPVYALISSDTSSGVCICDTAQSNSSIPLSVSWDAIRGWARREGNLLEWDVVLQPGHEEFHVQRFGEGRWNTISEAIKDQGRSRFSWTDHAPGIREIYRIRQADTDGAVSHSNAVEILRQAAPLDLFPNPASQTFFIRGKAGSAYYLIDVWGNLQLQGVLQEGDTSVDASLLPAGLYLVKFGDQPGKVIKLILE